MLQCAVMKSKPHAWASLRCLAALSALLVAACQPTLESHDEPSLRVTVTDQGHEVPDTVAAGLRHVRFENRGSDVHECLFVRLPDGMTAADFSAAVSGGELFPKGTIDYSGPGLTSPGETVDLWVALDPGRYVTTCWSRHPAGDGTYKLHVKLAPPHEFVVGSQRRDDPEPRADVSFRLVDFRIELDGDIRPGLRTLRVNMPGPSMHEMDIFRLHDGSDPGALKAWFHGDGSTPLPATALGGPLDSHDPRRTVWVRRQFVPGRYVAWCDMEMPASSKAKGMTHADIGMIREFVVAK